MRYHIGIQICMRLVNQQKMKNTQGKEKKQEKIQKILYQGLHGIGFPTKWEKLNNISKEKNKIEDKIYIEEGKTVFEKTIDWTKTYGELEEGTYSLTTNGTNTKNFTINFNIDKNSKVTYQEPKLWL